MKKNAFYQLDSITKFLIGLTVGLLVSQSVYSQDRIATLPNGEKVVLHADNTWDSNKGVSYDFDFSALRANQIPSFLRQGISIDKESLSTAVKMYLQGWRYTMPQPKSAQASWGNYDGRTTWWKGSWNNEKTNKYSRKTPVIQSNGNFYGDEQNDQNYWSNGGCPGYPTKIQWLLSSEGGVKPQ